MLQGTPPTIARSHDNSCAFEVHDASVGSTKHLWGIDVQQINDCGMFVVWTLLAFGTYRYFCRQTHRRKSQMFGQIQLINRQNIRHIWSAINKKSTLSKTYAVQRLFRVQPRDAIIACMQIKEVLLERDESSKTIQKTHSHETKQNITNENRSSSHPHIKNIY